MSLAILARLGPKGDLSRNDLLYIQGQDPDGVFFLLGGWVSMVRCLADGRAISLELVQPGDSIGVLEVMLEMPRMAEARVVTGKAKVVRIGRAALEAAAESDEDLIPGLVRRELERLAASQIRLADMLSSRSVARKIARVLGEYPAETVLPVSQEVIGLACGLAREEVTRYLGYLESRGILSRRPREIYLERPGLLRTLEFPARDQLRPGAGAR